MVPFLNGIIFLEKYAEVVLSAIERVAVRAFSYTWRMLVLVPSLVIGTMIAGTIVLIVPILSVVCLYLGARFLFGW